VLEDTDYGDSVLHVLGPNGLIALVDVASYQSFAFDPDGNAVTGTESGSMPIPPVSFPQFYDAYGLPAFMQGTGTYGQSAQEFYPWYPLQTSFGPIGYRAQWGYYTDQETGWSLCGFRYYDPYMGRWLTRDPTGWDGGLNLYAYCGGNPVGTADPLGLEDGSGLVFEPARQAAEESFRNSAEEFAEAQIEEVVEQSAGGSTALSYLYDLVPFVGEASPVYAVLSVADAVGTPIGKALANKYFGPDTLGVYTIDHADLAARARARKPNATKLNYMFGLATGRKHNKERSLDMKKQLQRIGINDTPGNRKYILRALMQALGKSDNISGTGKTGALIRDTLLMGPRGALKLEIYSFGWKISTIAIYGGD